MKVIKALIILFIFFFLIALGDLFQNLNIIPSIDYEMKMFDILNLLSTIAIALLIPFYISKFIDKEKSIKDFLKIECIDMLTEMSNLNLFLHNFKIGQNLTEDDKDNIMFLLEKSEKKLDNLIDYLLDAKLPHSVFNSDDFKNSFFKYWEAVTGGDLMSESFIYNEEFRSNETIAFSSLEKDIKKFIVKLSSY